MRTHTRHLRQYPRAESRCWGPRIYDAVGNRTRVEDSFGGVTTSTYNAMNQLEVRLFGGAGQTTARIQGKKLPSRGDYH